ncbi:hypothetical protein LCGC14_2104920 [marine sediment metagenome]|uniref:Uncharacterized protein n=1 Tax=marine sediment metagenome TaxID=412755 RepID=A0A0F9E8S1_9ZZZZ
MIFTVKELIEELKKMPQDEKVLIANHHEVYIGSGTVLAGPSSIEGVELRDSYERKCVYLITSMDLEVKEQHKKYERERAEDIELYQALHVRYGDTEKHMRNEERKDKEREQYKKLRERFGPIEDLKNEN